MSTAITVATAKSVIASVVPLEWQAVINSSKF